MAEIRDGLLHEALSNIAAGFDAVANAVPGAVSLNRISARLRQLADEIVPPPEPAPEPEPDPEPEPAPVDPPASEDPPPPPPAEAPTSDPVPETA